MSSICHFSQIRNNRSIVVMERKRKTQVLLQKAKVQRKRRPKKINLPRTPRNKRNSSQISMITRNQMKSLNLERRIHLRLI